MRPRFSYNIVEKKNNEGMADMKKLKAKYDMTVMLIVTDTNGQEVNFADYGEVTRGQKINR